MAALVIYVIAYLVNNLVVLFVFGAMFVIVNLVILLLVVGSGRCRT